MVTYFSTTLSAFVFILFTWIGVNSVNGARANVTLRMGLSYDVNPECDETVYKVIVCAGEFTNECQLLGPVARFIQATCAAQGPAEPLTFSVNTVENPIELDVTVQRVGENTHHRLRRTEFRLTEAGEVTVTSLDLTLIVRFQVDYFCLPNYFGRLCNVFCNTQAEEHICDERGNPICRSGYFLDRITGECRKDKCLSMPNYCLNGGTCVNSPEVDTRPRCLCLPDFGGLRCEFEHQSTREATTTSNLPTSTKRTEPSTESSNRLYSKVASAETTANPEIGEVIPDKFSTAPTADPTQIVPTSTIPMLKVKKNVPMQDNDGGDKTVKTVSNKETTVYLSSNSDEIRYRALIVPTVAVTLILALVIVCIGFVIWICSRRGQKHRRLKKLQRDQTDSNLLVNPAKRWASVDQSPTRLYTFDDQIASSPVCLPSLNGTQFTTFCDPPVDRDVTYGGSVHTSFIPTRHSLLDSYSHSVDPPRHYSWNEGNNHFATLPRPFTLRRLHEEHGLTDHLQSPFMPYTRISPTIYPAYTDGLVNPYMQWNSTIGQSLIEQQPHHSSLLTPVMSAVTTDGLSRIYQSHSSRAPSVHSGCLTGLEPHTSSGIYGSMVVPHESVHGVVPNTDISSSVMPTSSTPTEEQLEQNNVSGLPPPPPSQFADTFLEC